MSQNKEYEEIDPIVGRMLELLKSTPERDIHAVRAGKSKFLSELNTLFPTTYAPAAGNWTSRSLTVQEPARAARGQPARLSRRPAYMYAVFAVLAIILFLSTGLVTARAAEDAIPGDALYPIKTGLESARLAVTTDPDRKVELYLNYAHRRLKEANALIQIGRYVEAEAVVVELEAKVKSADVILDQMEQTNPEKAEDLKTEMVMRLAGFSLVVNTMTNVAPPSLQPALNSALTSVDDILVEESGSGSDPLPSAAPADNGEGAAGGEPEPVDGNENAAGGANANDGNGQDNTNTSGDPNANGNSNGGVANTNDNANANANQNDNSNGNGTCVDADADGFCDDNANANNNANGNNGNGANNNGNGENNNGGNDGNNNGGDNNGGGNDDDDNNGRGQNNNGDGWGKGGKPK